MKNSEFRGLGSVYKYTLTQTVKTKSFIITMIIMLVFACLVFPVMNFINSDTTSNTSTSDEASSESSDNEFKVYVNNESGVSLDYDAFKEANKSYANVEFEETIIAYTEVLDNAKAQGTNAVYLSVMLQIENYSYHIEVNFDEDMLSESKTKAFAKNFNNWFEDYKTDVLKLSEAQLAAIDTTLELDDVTVSKFVSDEQVQIITEKEYFVVYALVMIIYFLIVFSATTIANKVVEEKANRVVEYLLTTVKPMALICGKVLVSLTVTVCEVGILAGAAIGSNKLSAQLFGISNQKSALSGFISFEAMKNLNVGSILIFVLVTGLGVLIYGFLAGLCGATVSKMEDIQQGLKVYNATILICFIVAIVSANMMTMSGLNAFTTFTLVFPLTSPFMLPGVIVIGKTSWVVVAIAVALLAIAAFFMLKLVSLVYEAVIVMNGDPISFGKLVKIAKNRRKKA